MTYQRYQMTITHPHSVHFEPFSGEIIAESWDEARDRAEELVPKIAEQWAVEPHELLETTSVHPHELYGFDWEDVEEFVAALPELLDEVRYTTISDGEYDYRVRATRLDGPDSVQLEATWVDGEPPRYCVEINSLGGREYVVVDLSPLSVGSHVEPDGRLAGVAYALRKLVEG